MGGLANACRIEGGNDRIKQKELEAAALNDRRFFRRKYWSKDLAVMRQVTHSVFL